MRLPSKKDYPEHRKMHAVKDKSQEIGNFIEWLHEKGLAICVSEERARGIEWYPTTKNIETLLAEYFDIDLKKIGEEKDKMVEEMRKQCEGTLER